MVGVPVWLDSREQPSGPIWSEIERVLLDGQTSAAVVWLCSTTRDASEVQRKEMGLAIRRAGETRDCMPPVRSHIFVTDGMRPSEVSSTLELPEGVAQDVQEWS